MAEQKITLIIDEEGCISAKAEGFNGEACLEALDKILENQAVVNVRTTSEYSQKVSINNCTTVKQGR
ncbi:DUF2997 domain-containing protein [Pelagibaculum spongiae]|uniref:DUF2997 domain-containing protein n=1 Tax=Pelagibaculum spongiae TaxID=2080658 RepID=A0A2V1GXC1_9GAMM|nr:DUF2997 domain-containing protein [Pelagibaculum spongiae]PVZ68914.1 hypothetical protein DC094_11720 [Pelagibaculum spongiae]